MRRYYAQTDNIPSYSTLTPHPQHTASHHYPSVVDVSSANIAVYPVPVVPQAHPFQSQQQPQQPQQEGEAKKNKKKGKTKKGKKK